MQPKKMADSKPTVLLLPWLAAPQQRIETFVTLYEKLGFQVIVKKCNITDFLWPERGIQNGRRFLIDLQTEINPDGRPLIIHAFLIGCFFYSIILHCLNQEPTKFKSIRSMICCQIMDSPVVGNLREMAYGVGKVSTKGTFRRLLVQYSTMFYFMATKSYTVRYYHQLINAFKYSSVNVPSVLLSSDNDPMALPQQFQGLCEIWSKNISQFSSRVWNNSAHIMHFKRHPEEYKQIVTDVLGKALPNHLALKSSL